MASYSAQNGAHPTLGAGAADNVTLSGCRGGVLRIRNRGTGGAPLYFRVYAPNAATKTPAVAAGNDTIVVPWGEFVDYAWSYPTAYVSIISADAQAFSVESLPGLA